MVKPSWETSNQTGKPSWESGEASSPTRPSWERPEFKQSQFPAMSTSDIQANVKQKLGVDLAPAPVIEAPAATEKQQTPIKNLIDYFKRESQKTTEQKQQDIREFAETPLGSFGYGLTQAATLGLALPTKEGREVTGIAAQAHPGVYTAGQIAGSIIPGLGAESLVATAGKSLLSKISSKLAQRLIIGGTAGVGTGAIEGFASTGSLAGAAKGAGLGSAMGLGGELAGYGLGKLAGKLTKSKKPPMATPAQTPDFYVSPEGTAVRDIDLSRKLLTEGTPGPKGGPQEVVIDAYPGRETPFTAIKGELSGLKNTPNETDRLSTYIDYAINVFKAYYDDAMANRRELSEKQTRRVTGSENVKQAYEDLIRVRRIKSLVDKIKAIQKDQDMSDAEKTEKINELSKQIEKLQK